MSTILLQITSGRGPIECTWVVARLADEIISGALKSGIDAELIEEQKGSAKGTLISALVHLKGDRCDDFARSYEGTVQWIGNSRFRIGHKRKNWFVGVQHVAMPPIMLFSDKDVRIDTMRSSGPGGQHVNKTESAIRATHLPTKLVAISRDGRSQIANRQKALERLAILVARFGQNQAGRLQQKRWNAHNQLVRGNPVRI